MFNKVIYSRAPKSPRYIRFLKWMGLFAGVGVITTFHQYRYGPVTAYRKKAFREAVETADMITMHDRVPKSFFGEKRKNHPMDNE